MKCRSSRNTIPPLLQSVWRTRYPRCSRAGVVVGRSAHRKSLDGLLASNEVVCRQSEADAATRLCERRSAARAIRASSRGRPPCRVVFGRREERARPCIPMLTPSHRSCAGNGHIARAVRRAGRDDQRRERDTDAASYGVQEGHPAGRERRGGIGSWGEEGKGKRGQVGRGDATCQVRVVELQRRKRQTALDRRCFAGDIQDQEI